MSTRGALSRFGVKRCSPPKCPNGKAVVDRTKNDRETLVKETISKGNSSPKSGSADGWKLSSSLVSMSGSLSVSVVNISGVGTVSSFVAMAVGSSLSNNSFPEEGDVCAGT